MKADYIVLRRSDGRAHGIPSFPMTAGPSPAGAGGSRGPGPSSSLRPNLEQISVEVAQLDANDVRDLEADPDTAAVVQSMPLRLVQPVPMDEAAAQSFSQDPAWGITAVGADTSPFDGAGITVAVLDTGIDAAHPAFAGAEVVQRDFTGEGDGDNNGHGTHCAGTIAGRDVGGTRIGVAPAVQRILAGKVLSSSGGETKWIADAIKWALDQNAHVISLSLGIDFPGFVKRAVEEFDMDEAVATSLALEQYRNHIVFFGTLGELVGTTSPFQQGAYVVAASGNESGRPSYEITVAPPAASENITAVGAVGRRASDGALVTAPFSNANPNLVGPGVGIVSAAANQGDGLVALSGTSMATPHVAGVAALWAQAMLETGQPFDVPTLTARVVGQASRVALASQKTREVGSGLVRAPQG